MFVLYVCLEDGKTLIVAETMERGTISVNTYISFVKAAGGFCVAFFVILIFVVNVGTTAFSSWWLAQWIRAGGVRDILLNIYYLNCLYVCTLCPKDIMS